MKIAELTQKIKEMSSKKKTQYLAIILIIAVILMLYFSSLQPTASKNSEEQKNQSQAAAASVNTDMESRLKTILGKVSGAGNVDVVINYESTAELVPAFSEDTQTSTSTDNGKSSETTSEKTDVATVQGDGSQEALIIKENQPEVRGVIVVAEGADNISVRMNLLSAVTTLLNVTADKVEILKMNNNVEVLQ